MDFFNIPATGIKKETGGATTTSAPGGDGNSFSIAIARADAASGVSGCIFQFAMIIFLILLLFSKKRRRAPE